MEVSGSLKRLNGWVGSALLCVRGAALSFMSTSTGSYLWEKSLNQVQKILARLI